VPFINQIERSPVLVFCQSIRIAGADPDAAADEPAKVLAVLEEARGAVTSSLHEGSETEQTTAKKIQAGESACRIGSGTYDHIAVIRLAFRAG
jgi:hypothetical protein